MTIKMCLLRIILILCFSATASAKPIIVYINADDLGVMDVGYKNSAFRTPHLDLLAAEGLVFENAYAPAANCAPSRACVHSAQWTVGCAPWSLYRWSSTEDTYALPLK